MGEWHKMEANKSPCSYCTTGWGNISSWVDPVTGEMWQKSEDCSETCQKLKDYFAKEEVNYARTQ